MMVELPGDREVNPIGKAFKRVRNGETESVVYFWEVMTKKK